MIQRLSLILLIVAALSAAEKKPRVAVLAFTAKGVSQMESEAVTELFSSSLVSSRAFDVLDRANMENILREQQFQQTGCTETACAVKIGKVLNVEYMIYGAVMNIGDKYFVSANMVNIETSKIEKSAQESTDNFKQINEALKRLVEKMTGITMEDSDKGTKIKYFGRITSVSGNEVTINAGSDDGVRLNEEYVVLSGKKVKRRNDQTGMVENVNERTEIGKVRISSVSGTDAKGFLISGYSLSGSLIDFNTIPYNNVDPLIVGAISLLSPAAGQFMIRGNWGGQILGVATELLRDVILLEIVTMKRETAATSQIIYRGGVLNLFIGDTRSSVEYGNQFTFSTDFIVFSGICVGLILGNTVFAMLAASHNVNKYDDMSKFAYANESSVSFAVAPTPEFDGMNVRFAVRW